jgi:hypothetical protein
MRPSDDIRRLGGLRPHERADVVPPIEPDGYDELLRDIEKRGVQVPLDILADGTVLDGRTRLAIARTLGLDAVPVRVVAPDDPVDYMVRAALLRRHLTTAQRRHLNDVLRGLVTEVRTHPRTGEEMRMGMGQTQRAKALGVEVTTVEDWDKRSPVDTGDRDAPTHFLRGGGNPTPYPLHPARPKPKQRAGDGPTPRHRDFAKGPPWLSPLTRWCRKALPEQRRHLLRIKAEVDRALALIDGQEGTT